MAKHKFCSKDLFESKFIPEPNSGCWLWIGASNKVNHYGVFQYNRNAGQAHRFSWMTYRGKIPPGLNVLHKCDVRSCVNPDHLYLGTQLENMRDMSIRGRAGKRRRTRIITEAEIIEIRRAKGITKEIATQFGLTQSQVGFLKWGIAWSAPA